MYRFPVVRGLLIHLCVGYDTNNTLIRENNLQEINLKYSLLRRSKQNQYGTSTTNIILSNSFIILTKTKINIEILNILTINLNVRCQTPFLAFTHTMNQCMN